MLIIDFFDSILRSLQSSIKMAAADETMTSNSDGSITYYDNHGQLHRLGGPAIIYLDGDIEYWIHGNLHRIGAPAFMTPDGAESWWLHGNCHRTDGPARTKDDGTQEWWINGYEVDPF